MKALATFLLALVAAPAFAQLGNNLAAPFETEPPFTVSAVLDRTAVRFGDTFRVGIVLDASAHHKIYRSSVKVALDSQEYVSIVDIRVPDGVRVKAEANAPAGEAVLTGRSVIVITMRAAAKEKTPPGLGEVPARFTVDFQGCSDITCFAPDIRTLLVKVPLTDSADRSKPANEEYFAAAQTNNLTTLAGDLSAKNDFSREVESRGFLLALLWAFGAGFLVSFTPCVWPLIPIVLAIVGASAEGSGWKRGLRLSLAYVVGMALTYAVFGALAGALGHSVQGVMQNPWVVGVVCLVFVALALSMFGLYDIRLPAGVAGKLQQRRAAGIVGVLVTGAVSGLVASPCVSAPLLGLFAGVATLGSIWVGALAGFVFALGMGVILIVAGTSSKALAALPRSGEWMVSIKHFFGWVMLGVAVYFSEMLFGYFVFRLLMGLLLAAAVFCIALSLGKKPETVGRRVLKGCAIVLLSLGMAYFPWGKSPSEQTAVPIEWIPSVEAGLARAKAENKPAIIDVTATWCTYCQEMERDVFSKDAFVAESRRFVMIRFDATTRTEAVDAFFKKYGIEGVPAFVFIRSDGTNECVNGAVDLDTFLNLMRATQ